MARQILIHRVRVVVVVHVVEAKKHLAYRATMHENQRWAGTALALGHKELPVDFEAVIALENHLLRYY